jgi:hypothetical protein
MVALHLDFVTKPNGASGLTTVIESVLDDARLGREGLESGVLLVSDREARLVTLLTFWESGRFCVGRERRIQWMQKLLAPYADGPIRAHTCVPNFLLHERVGEFDSQQAVAERNPAFA